MKTAPQIADDPAVSVPQEGNDVLKLLGGLLPAYGAKRRGDNIQAGKFLSNH